MPTWFPDDVNVVKPTTVAELIAHLGTLPQNYPVIYRAFSENCILELKDIEVIEAGVSRSDGWVHDKRSDKAVMTYIRFPGN